MIYRLTWLLRSWNCYERRSYYFINSWNIGGISMRVLLVPWGARSSRSSRVPPSSSLLGIQLVVLARAHAQPCPIVVRIISTSSRSCHSHTHTRRYQARFQILASRFSIFSFTSPPIFFSFFLLLSFFIYTYIPACVSSFPNLES